ncbi:hypothetical protein Cgig2_007941 [Carnegiea gigantea]|uniref:Ion transport domain-containing protein n=1 Tax=Carnegiea gigantea TaxID=171969 RepID=A0A9Q1KEZ4_9CARY|nr:hypothetical protein Cgig2_007941 [Carnegiea gigantea]
MKYNQEKVVRFEDWVPHKSADGQFLVKDDTVPGKFRRWLSSISDWFKIVLDFLSQRLKRIGKTLAGNAVAILIVIPKMRGSRSLNTKNLVKFTVFFQYIPRVLRVFPLYNEVTKTSGILTETAWAGAAFNLFLYMLASHVLGAFWYLFSIERETTCWRQACGKHRDCDYGALFCDMRSGNNTFLNDFCPITSDGSGPFDFGMFLNALKSGVVQTTDFPKKFFFCFWWGLQNLRHIAQ